MDRRFLTLLITVAALTLSAIAVDLIPAKLEKYISFYEDGEYEKSIDSLQNLLKVVDGINIEYVIEINKYLGFSFVMTDRIDSAKTFFKTMLSFDSRKKLDPIMVPPNIYTVFREVRLEKDLQEEKTKKNNSFFWISGGVALVATGGLVYMLLKGNPEEEEETGSVKWTWEVQQ